MSESEYEREQEEAAAAEAAGIGGRVHYDERRRVGTIDPAHGAADRGRGG